MENDNFSKLNKDNFKVPDGYFESLEDKVLSRFNSSKTEPKVIVMDHTNSRNQIIRRIMIAATSVAACAAFIIFYNRGGEVNSFNLSNLDNKEIIKYLNENADELDLDLLVDGSKSGSGALELTDTDNKYINEEELLDEINIEELF